MDRATIVAPPRVYARTLACALCQQRKIKCDRNFPCATCVRGGVGASCVPSTPAPVRQRRRPAQDLRRRLARCEEMLLQNATTAQSSEPQVQYQLQEVPLQVADGGSPGTFNSPAHIFVKNENSTRLMDSRVWAALYEELRDMREIVENQANELDADDSNADHNGDLLLSGVDPSLNVQDLQPDPAHVFRLWQLFLDRVNPLTKIVHVPTLQPILLDATTNICAVPVHYQALLFTIYLMATVSISSEESLQTFGVPKEEALRRYTLGAKASLIKFNFLKNENMTILQALVFFQLSLTGRYDRYASWLLTGIIMRIAHKMGYHRDGEALSLTPFETEMRRRIWWQITVRDTVQGAMGGILSPSLLPAGSDTKEPQNLNDADLFPNSTEPPRPHEGPTEMAFCLILYRAHKLMSGLQCNLELSRAVEAAMLGQTLDGKNTVGEIQWTLTRFRNIATSIQDELQTLESKYVDPKIGNVHSAAHGPRSMLLVSLAPSLTPIQEQPEWGVEILTPEDNIFKVLILGHEHVCMAYELLSKLNFEWWMAAHFQTETLTALIGQLRQRTTGSLAERGWQVLEKTFGLINVDAKQHRIQAQYALKAWQCRERALVEAGQQALPPAFIERLRATLGPLTDETPEGSCQTGSSSATQDTDMFTPTTDLDGFFEGFDPSESTTWSSWGDFSAAADE